MKPEETYAEMWIGTHPSGPSRVMRDGSPGPLLKVRELRRKCITSTSLEDLFNSRLSASIQVHMLNVLHNQNLPAFRYPCFFFLRFSRICSSLYRIKLDNELDLGLFDLDSFASFCHVPI